MSEMEKSLNPWRASMPVLRTTLPFITGEARAEAARMRVARVDVSCMMAM